MSPPPAGPTALPVRRRWQVLPRAAIGLLLFAAGPEGQAAVTVHSRSGQFIVHSDRSTPPSLSQIGPGGTNNLVALYPDPVAVSCERIKSALLAELGRPDRWRGKIHVTIDPRGQPVAFPTAVGLRYGDGWHYALRLPRELEGPALIRGVVHALLSEIANRTPGPAAPEIPIWLVEALTGQILGRVGPDPLARPNRVTGRYGVGIGQLQAALTDRAIAEENRQLLRTLHSRPLLTFEELSLPSADLLRGEALEHYRACAQVFFVSLRQLPGGPQAFAQFLSLLPQHLNWQTAFLIAFHPHFSRLLDVEKWWALGAQELRAAVGSSMLSAPTGLLWLEDLLGFLVDIQETAETPRQRRFVPLISVLIDWSAPLQNRLLPIRVRQLRQLAASLPPEVKDLASAYANTLQNYLDQRERLRTQPSLPGLTAAQGAANLRDTVARLEALHTQRLEMRTRLGLP